ncbi:MAG: hypothetical protein ABIL18_08465, partial [candidate division WOR-3 bacterium]
NDLLTYQNTVKSFTYSLRHFNLNNLQVCYSTNKDTEDSIFANEETVIFIINEVFVKYKHAEIIPQNKQPIGVRDLYKLYEQFDTKFIQNLKGNFKIIIYHKGKNLCLIFNSRLGVTPFYYNFNNDVLVFSTNLQMMANALSSKNSLDKVGIAEYAILGYPLGDRTIFEDVKSLLPAAYLIIREGSVEVKKYWDCKNLIDQELYSQKSALEIGSELFKTIVNQYSKKPEKICLSLTGGFDGRTILAVLEKEPENFLCYSFGIPGSLNISIPQKMCRENGINYLPIYLDDAYEKTYDEYATEAIYLSDCLSTFERANYPYTFKKLSHFSPIVITGIFGSELMRTFQNVAIGYLVSENFVKINFIRDKKSVLASIIKHIKENSYYNPALFDNCDEIVEYIYEECFKKYEGLNDNQRFYLSLLNEGARKYFGGEVHMERFYATNRFPFLDDEFVEFVFKSPFSGIYTNPLKPTINQRLNSQLFYSYIIKKYRPKLLNYTTDHGYPPKYLLSKAPILQIGPCFVSKKIKHRLTGYREFKTEEWSENFYRKHLFKKTINDSIFSKRLQDDFTSGLWKKRRIDFARAASLKLYLELWQTKKYMPVQS